jgi:nitrogen regulatory protein PII
VITISFYRKGVNAMRTITIIAEQVSDCTLNAVVPPKGVASVSIGANRAGVDDIDTATYRSFRNPSRFKANYRIEMVVEDDAVDTVFNCISFAYGVGLLSDAEMWVNSSALALVA